MYPLNSGSYIECKPTGEQEFDINTFSTDRNGKYQEMFMGSYDLSKPVELPSNDDLLEGARQKKLNFGVLTPTDKVFRLLKYPDREDGPIYAMDSEKRLSFADSAPRFPKILGKIAKQVELKPEELLHYFQMGYQEYLKAIHKPKD